MDANDQGDIIKKKLNHLVMMMKISDEEPSDDWVMMMNLVTSHLTLWVGEDDAPINGLEERGLILEWQKM
jgi:hypothetical protein